MVDAARKPDRAPAAEREAPGAEAGASALETLRAKGEAALRENRFDDAIRAFGEAVALDPDDGRTRLQLGVALQGAGRHAEAASALAEAQRALPDDAAPFPARCGFPARARRRQGGAGRGERSLPPRPGAAGGAFLALGLPERAAQAFGAAARLAPQWADAYVNFGVARYRGRLLNR